MSIPQSKPGQVEKAQSLGTGPADARTIVEKNEAIHQRGLLLSVMQAVVLLVGLALLLVVAAPGIFVSIGSVIVVLAILGCLHYWLWGRELSRAKHAKSQRTLTAR